MIKRYHDLQALRPPDKVKITIMGKTSDFLYMQSKLTEANVSKLHRKVKQNEQSAQYVGSKIWGQGHSKGSRSHPFPMTRQTTEANLLRLHKSKVRCQI